MKRKDGGGEVTGSLHGGGRSLGWGKPAEGSHVNNSISTSVHVCVYAAQCLEGLVVCYS